MSELLKSLLGLVNPVGAQREQINLLTLEKSQLVSLVGEMQRHIENLESEIETLRTKDATNSEQIRSLEKKLSEQPPPPSPVINNGPGSWVKARRGR
ncbi:MAG: hypothetical protein IPH39_04140 [Sulfuritalea sp.]|nr:hypothetical protein [Sulfuritalea sp.]MBK9349332.1 hypothetical protein [Sulfuritalea sp.]